MTRYVTYRESVEERKDNACLKLVVPVEEIDFKPVSDEHAERVCELSAELTAELRQMDPPAKFIIVTQDTEI